MFAVKSCYRAGEALEVSLPVAGVGTWWSLGSFPAQTVTPGQSFKFLSFMTTGKAGGLKHRKEQGPEGRDVFEGDHKLEVWGLLFYMISFCIKYRFCIML